MWFDPAPSTKEFADPFVRKFLDQYFGGYIRRGAKRKIACQREFRRELLEERSKTMCCVEIVQRFCAVGLVILATGCSSPPKASVVEAIGPAPSSMGAAESSGYLVVYSAWSNFVDQGSTGHHSRYILSSDNGKTSREVINHVDRFDEGPIRLPLAPGAYHVRARSAHFGRVNVPVVIQSRQTTVVYLDGRSHPQVPESEQAAAVKLPDGEVVGWAATTPNGAPH